MRAFFAIPAAGAAFFFSAWLAMIFWGILSPDLGVPKIGYTKAMLVTIALWLVVAPLAGAVARKGPWRG